VLTPKIKQQLDDIDAEFETSLKMSERVSKRLKSEIKELVVQYITKVEKYEKQGRYIEAGFL